MKIGKKELSWLAALVGILAVVLVVSLIYLPYKDETEALKAECQTLQARVDELKGWEREIPMYNEANEAAKKDINEIVEKFPVDSLEEDAILYAAKLEARNSNTSISSVGLGNPELLYSVGPIALYLSDEDEENGISRTFQLYRQQITFANQFSYNGMKQFIKDIVDDENSRTIDGLTVSYDRSTGILVGNTNMNLFTLYGTDESYEKPDISGIPLGTNNIFGTLVDSSEVVYDNVE